MPLPDATDDLALDAACAAIAQRMQAVADIETMPLRLALGRVAADDILSPLNVPAYDNAAMDGYALRGSDLAADGPTRLRPVGRGLAGHAFTEPVPPGACVRIMTGAVMPPGCDTVVPQELCTVDATGDVLIAADSVRPGGNRRTAGDDLAQGAVAIAAGTLLRPAHIGLLAALGAAEVPVRRRVRVAFFSSGDELRPVGSVLDAGCVYDSNRHTLWSLLDRLGCDTIDLGCIPDRPEAVRDALRRGCSEADVVLSTGGVSVGEADHLRGALTALGRIDFWRVALRPGRPVAFGELDADGHRARMFALPGNPVAVMIVFYLLVRPALLRMMGVAQPGNPTTRARLATPVRKRPGRTEVLRVSLSRSPQGDVLAEPLARQGSGVLSSMAAADGLALLPHSQGNAAAGDWVDVLPFEGLV